MTFRKLVGESYPPHDFEKNKVIQGVLVEKRNNVGPNQSKLFVVETKGGVKESIWGSAVLNNIDTLPIGSMIRVTFLGREKGKRGVYFKNYDIEVDDDAYIPDEDIPTDVPEDLNGQ